MRPYTKQDIETIYLNLIHRAPKNYIKNRINNALKDIITASYWAYSFNHIYCDPEAENLLKLIGDNNIKPKTIETPMKDHCVLIDSFLLDNRGLSQQYLRAMMANGMYILVIYTNAGGEIGRETLAEIKSYEKAQIVTFSKGIDMIEEARQIASDIIEFKPAHIFLHLTPWDVVALMACNAIKGALIYNINLTDHAFWLGTSFINYNIEFRPCGMTISLEKRNLNNSQLIHLPYYPIVPISSCFQGFPTIPEDSVRVFTGGAVYKMLGDGCLFFKIMDKILDISPKVYILVAGFKNDKRFEKQRKKMRHADRVLLIGVRNDIDAVFDNIDIYLNTYPLGGGLMLEYAAKKGKPILAYREKYNVIIAIEGIINPDGNPEISAKSFTDLDAMMEYARRLVMDKEFIKEEGWRIKNGLMTSETFNNLFRGLINGKTLLRGWEMVPNINYDRFFESYLERENRCGYKATQALILSQKLKALMKVTNKKSNIIEAFFLTIMNAPPYLSNFFLKVLWIFSHKK